jgi:hypothetical protein
MRSALQWMLLAPPTREDNRSIVRFPTWPCEEWDADFKVIAPGQTAVHGKLEGGKLVHLSVTPQSRRADVAMANCGAVPAE